MARLNRIHIRFFALTFALAAVGFLVPWNMAGQQRQSAPTATADAAPRQLMDQYCVTCHNERLKTAGLRLDKDAVDSNNPTTNPEVWEKVIRKIRAGAMPPPKMPRPDKASLDHMAAFFEDRLDRAALAKPDPGQSPAFHRLNRTEYQNAIRDLLDADIDVSEFLPPDGSTELGFDNIASSLTLSPVLLEQYMSAARKISDLVLSGESAATDVRLYEISAEYKQDNRRNDMPFGTQGGAVIRHYFPANGEYSIKVGVGGSDASAMDVRIDGERVGLITLPGAGGGGGRGGRGAPGAGVGGGRGGRGAPPLPGADAGVGGDAVAAGGRGAGAAGGRGAGGGGGRGAGAAGGRGAGGAPPDAGLPAIDAPPSADPELTIPVKAGAHSLAITFQGRPPAASEGLTRSGGGGGGRGGRGGGGGGGGGGAAMRTVNTVTITGPRKALRTDDSPSFKRIMTCVPQNPSQEQGCAHDILASLARRAYRRPVADSDVQRLMPFYLEGRKSGGFTSGIQLGLQRVLVSPSFLFRIEVPPAGLAKNAVYRLGDIELASRLSFFLWSSIPDDSLMADAAAGRLKDPKVFSDQVTRMLADPKSDALVRNFAGQWLRLRELDHAKPDPRSFPSADKSLTEALRRQTELLFDSVLREKRSVYDLLTADFMFVNERLARHYGIPNVYGDHFRKISLAKDDVRGGLLGQGSILMLTSYADRTSPVQRGKFVLDSLMGDPPPPPPPNVPPLKNENTSGKTLSMRDRMVQHRANPVCATCHSRMDPIGFALEGFDGIGRSRTTGEDGSTIDTSGALPDGTVFNGPAALRDALLRNKEQFRNRVIEKLLIYALGREVTYADAPAVRDIARKATLSKDSLYQLIAEVTQSIPFQMRRSE